MAAKNTVWVKPLAVAVIVLAVVYAFRARPKPEAGPAVVAASTSAASSAEAAAASATPAPTPEVPFDLSDLRVGSATAPVTVVEYASLTCGHCADFQKDVWPQIKAKYVDTGKVAYVFRDFPLDGAALHAALLSRCVGATKRADMIEMLMSEQRRWLEGDSIDAVKTHLLPYGRLAGLTDARMQQCFESPVLRDAVIASHKTGESEFKVDATPAIFVNGVKVQDGATFEHVSAAIEAASAAPAAVTPAAAPSGTPTATAPGAAASVAPAATPAPTATPAAAAQDEDQDGDEEKASEVKK